MAGHDSDWRVLKRIQGQLGTEFGRTQMVKRRQALLRIVHAELDPLPEELLIDVVELFQADHDKYVPEVIRELVEGQGKEYLLTELHAAPVRDVLARYARASAELLAQNKELSDTRSRLTEYLLGGKLSFRSLVPFWRSLMLSQSKLAELGREIESLREGFQKTQVDVQYRTAHEEHYVMYHSIAYLAPLLDRLCGTIQRQLESIRERHASVSAANDEGLARLREALEFTTAQNAHRTEINTSVLNFLFLVAAIAQILGLLQIGREAVTDNLETAKLLAGVTVAASFVLIIATSGALWLGLRIMNIDLRGFVRHLWRHVLALSVVAKSRQRAARP